jgi:hypothetical protein
MNSLDSIKEELEKVMGEKFEKEFRDTWGIIARTYGVGIDEGKAKAKAEIINLIQGDQNENKTDI